MDIALAVEYILPAASYMGSVTANTNEAWELVIWTDTRREKPTWKEIEEAEKERMLETVIEEYKAKIQNRLDTFAQTREYGGILSACTRATSAIDMLRVDGQYCVDAQDNTWIKAYTVLQEMRQYVATGGTIPEWEVIESLLPPLAWPEGSDEYADKC